MHDYKSMEERYERGETMIPDPRDSSQKKRNLLVVLSLHCTVPSFSGFDLSMFLAPVWYRRRLSRKRNPLGIIVLWLFAHSLIQKDRKCLLLLVVHQYYLRKCKTMLKNKNKFQNMSYKRRTATDISGVSAWYFLYRITCVERHPKKTKICITSIGDVRFCFV
jgi:hypothetical protein